MTDEEDICLEDLSKSIAEKPDENQEQRLQLLVEAEGDKWSELDPSIYLQLTGALINYSKDHPSLAKRRTA